MNYRPYKRERFALFLQLRSEGKTRAEIAAAMGLSPATIKSKLEYLRVRDVL